MAKSASELKHILSIYGPAMILVIAAFVVAFQFIKPAPPSKVVIASGGTAGAYYANAMRYAAYMAQEDIELEVRVTAGSKENLQLLESGEVDIAMVQGGIEGETGQDLLQSLGSIYYEPLWLFHRKDVEVKRLTDLSGLRVAIGGEGSGTKALVTELLNSNHVEALLDARAIGGASAKSALEAGEVDAAFFVTSASSALVSELLRDNELALASLSRNQAYARRFHYLNALKLPEGVVDLGRNIPTNDIHLLAPAANIVVHPELHPAIIDLLLQAAQEVHKDGSILEKDGEFPSPEYLAFTLNDSAERYYEHGPPFLQRYLPLWAASLLDRIKIMLLPLFMLMIPLFKIMPPIYTWRMRARVYRWYEELEAIHDETRDAEAVPSELLKRLDKLEHEVWDIELPLSFTAQLYDLRLHIDLVRQRLR